MSVFPDDVCWVGCWLEDWDFVEYCFLRLIIFNLGITNKHLLVGFGICEGLGHAFISFEDDERANWSRQLFILLYFYRVYLLVKFFNFLVVHLVDGCATSSKQME